MTTTSKPIPSRPAASAQAARPSSSLHGERGVSLLVVMIAVVAALGVGAVFGQPYLSSNDAPAWITERIPATSTSTSSTSTFAGAAVDDTDIEGPAEPALRAGRHADFDRIVLTSVSGCSFTSLR